MKPSLSFLLPFAILITIPAIAADEGSTERNRWLTSRLYGNDNDMAALRRAWITREGEGYRLHVANQFSFGCTLAFSAKGRPEKLNDCAPELQENADWRVKEPEIILRCITLKAEIVCKGPYTLVNGDYSSAGEITVARRR